MRSGQPGKTPNTTASSRHLQEDRDDSALFHPGRAPETQESSKLIQQTPWDRQVSAPEQAYALIPLGALHVRRMSRRYEQLFASEAEAVRTYGKQLFQRIASPNWSVEWNLPLWLGDRYGLTEIQQWHLVTANVFGLGYVRLHDDRRDGEAHEGDASSASSVETRLFQAAQEELRRLLGADGGFWETFNTLMDRWRAAGESRYGKLNVLTMPPDQRDQLADIGAPLLISCAACVTLQPEAHDLDTLTAPVRHYLTAAVLFDHLKDWQADLSARRVNLFIRTMLDHRVDTLDQEATQRAIYGSLIRGDELTRYIELVVHELIQGAELAHHLGLRPLRMHLLALASEARESGERMQRGIQNYIVQGQELFLPGLISG
jgi:hypothetical protein